METKNTDEKVLRLYQNSLYKHHFSVPPTGVSGGLMLSWKEDINVEILYSSCNIIDTHIQAKKASFFASFIYGAPKMEDRPAFWNKFMELGKNRNDAWLVTGDFNDLLDNTEKLGGPLRWEGSFLAFRSFVSQMGLWDLPHAGNHLSWRGMRYQHFIQSRLDRAMSNCSWSEKFPSGRSIYLRFEGSDHRPLLTLFDQSKSLKKGSFRFDRRLHSKPEVRELVKNHWPHPQQESVISKTSRIRAKIIEWTKAQNEKSNEIIRAAQLILEEALSAPSPDTDLIASTTSKLEKAYREEEEYWKQRSRIQWLQSGDRNSSFFHAITRGRRQINAFSILEDEHGAIYETEEDIVATISKYYQSIFTTSGANCIETVEEALSPCITSAMNSDLIALPDREEVKAAVLAIHADKAPGPDGFSAGFYHSYWDIIGEDIYRDIREFFETGYLHHRQNETHIRLILKITCPRKVADYRPIALCTTHYKIIAKIMTKCLQPFLPHIISPHQSAFVPKRAIGDNVLITHEILHYLKTSKAKVRCSMAVKTDMSKAHDRIEWSFLEAILRRLGFHETWISWTMMCVTSVSYSFLVNGAPQGHVSPSQGLRKGDPLSPYLFILCTEVLSGLCTKAQNLGLLTGVKVARNNHAINHLLFADDTMFFMRSDAQSCAQLVSLLNKY